MKNIFRNIWAAALLPVALTFGLAGCDTDIEPVYLLPTDPTELGGASSDIVLTPDKPDALVLSIYWTGDGKLSLSDDALQAPQDYVETSIQLSATEDFASTVDIYLEKGARSRQFLNDELNSLVGRLDFAPDVMSPLYIRIRNVVGANIEPDYSNVLTVNVQPYYIDFTYATVLDKDLNETGTSLASPEKNGIYTGFIGASSWLNWWLREANNVVWGNVGQTGKTFYASSDDSHWNFWFPEPSGCYYTTVNTVEGWWSAQLITGITVGGELSGEMTFNRNTRQWTLPITSSEARTASIRLACNTSLYNTQTTDMGPAIVQAMAFSGNASGLSFGSEAATISVELPAGTSTLILDLSDPLQWTLQTGEAAEGDGPAPLLYFSGLVDWNHFDYLTLYDEATLSYGGAHYINSEWGYQIFTEPAWDAVYSADEESTPYAGNIVPGKARNVPQPTPGLYVMDFSMKNMVYALTEVTSVTFAGLNDNWAETTMTQAADNPEVFTAEFVKTADTPWGVKVLINHDWHLFFGGGNGTLLLGRSDSATGFDGDNDLEIGGTYILTVDLGKQTYNYSPKE